MSPFPQVLKCPSLISIRFSKDDFLRNPVPLISVRTTALSWDPGVLEHQGGAILEEGRAVEGWEEWERYCMT